MLEAKMRTIWKYFVNVFFILGAKYVFWHVFDILQIVFLDTLCIYNKLKTQELKKGAKLCSRHDRIWISLPITKLFFSLQHVVPVK